jgi:hypothetical protein
MKAGVVKGIMVAVALAAALACTRKQSDDAYFPLGAGRTWSYTLTPDGEGMEPMKLTVAVVGQEDVGGAKVTRERIEVDGREHFLFVGVDERGIFRHATQSEGEAAPALDRDRDYFLERPIEIGHSWKGEAAPTFLDVADTAVPIESTIASTTDTVRTPAGEFKDCVKVHVTGSAEIRNEFLDDDDTDGDGDGDEAAEDDEEFDPVSGTFTLDEETWYAKDVGLVKSVVTETFKLKHGGDEDRARVTTELQAFTR